MRLKDCKKLAEHLDAPVCSGYQHNDSFPGSHPLALGPLGYNGSKAAMEINFKSRCSVSVGNKTQSVFNITVVMGLNIGLSHASI